MSPAEPALSQFFTKKAGCYIDGSDDGGQFTNDQDASGNSPDACAQVCYQWDDS